MQTFKHQRFKVKTKLKNVWQVIVRLFIDYFQHSSIHAVSYIGEKGRSCFERIWWIVAICISVLCCAKLIFDAWHIDPIIISFKSLPTPIWQIPFPAVSICPTVLTHYKHMNLTEAVYRQCSGPADMRRTKQLNAISMMCPADVIYKNSKNYPSCNDCLETLRKIRIPPEDLFVECKFQNRVINCMKAFNETIARIAMCYTFNGFDPYRDGSEEDSYAKKDWSIDEGYTYSSSLDTYPRRASGGGAQFGFTALLRLSKHDFEYRCSSNPGFYLDYRMAHNAPDLKTNTIEISMGFSYTIILTPKLMTTAGELQNYPISKRKCLLSHEYRLKYFKQYTQLNCEMECEFDKVLNGCGCLPINVEYRGNNDTCGFGKFKCSEHYVGILIDDDFKSCQCLPACTTMTYDSELFVTALNLSASSKHKDVYKEDFMYSQITIYFKENQFLTSERKELYGPTAFLANCGGLLGLFLGVSVISLLEIVYFCTIRLLCSLKINDHQGSSFPSEKRNDPPVKISFLKILKDMITDYSSKATIQGLKYATDVNLFLVERLWCTIVVVMSVLCCGYLISDVVRHYDQSPIIVSYANEETPISEIPFPAVTLCPNVVGKFVNEWLDQFKIRNLPFVSDAQPNQDFITALAQVCDPELFWDIDPENRTNCERCPSLFRQMMQEMDDFMTICFYETTPKPCEILFNEMITEAGRCFTFNGYDVYRQQNEMQFNGSDDWSLDDGYKTGTESSGIFPRPGSRSGLIVNLEAIKDVYAYLCKGRIKGFKVYIHLPNEIPLITEHHSYLVPYQQNVQFLVNPNMITAAPELRNIPVSKRQCYFSNERYLRFFKFYTQNNCEAECVANLTLRHCNCLRFHIPNVPGVKVCGISDIKCYLQIAQQSVKETIDQSQALGCNCLPTCNSMSYDIESSQNAMSNEALNYDTEYNKALIRYKCIPPSDDDDFEDNYLDNFNVADFSISFRENQFVTLQRSRLYGPTELLSQFGGLLGLFLGFSLMSILEFIYFCTIRLICSIKFLF